MIGCSKETIDQNIVKPTEYVESFGWHIEEEISKGKLEAKSLDPSSAKFVDIMPYVNKDIYITTYLLKEKQKTGNRVYAYVYQVDEEIIGGSGSLEGWLPGVFSLKDKERLINEGTIDT